MGRFTADEKASTAAGEAEQTTDAEYRVILKTGRVAFGSMAVIFSYIAWQTFAPDSLIEFWGSIFSHFTKLGWFTDLFIVVAILLFATGMLFRLKQKQPVSYGLLEMFAALLTIFDVGLRFHPDISDYQNPGKWTDIGIKAFGAVYIGIRGLTNFREGFLKEQAADEEAEKAAKAAAEAAAIKAAEAAAAAKGAEQSAETDRGAA